MENKNNTEYNYKIFETLEKVKPLHVIILLAILFGIGWVMNNEEQKDYEINEPRKFLRVDNTSGKGGIFESYVSGTITNTSNNTTYGEIEVELELFSESKKSI